MKATWWVQNALKNTRFQIGEGVLETEKWYQNWMKEGELNIATAGAILQVIGDSLRMGCGGLRSASLDTSTLHAAGAWLTAAEAHPGFSCFSVTCYSNRCSWCCFGGCPLP